MADKGRVAVCTEYEKPFEIPEYEPPDLEPGAIGLRKTHHRILLVPSILPTVMDDMVRTQDKVPSLKIVSHKFKLAGIIEAFPRAEWEQRQTDVTRAVLEP